MSRVSGTKTTQTSTFFKMGVSLGRPIWKRDYIWTSNRWMRTGQQRIIRFQPGFSPPGWGGGGGTLIFSYIRRLGNFFWFNIVNFNTFGGFQKNKYFLGY